MKTTILEEQIGKLPKWARSHIRFCENRANYAEQQLKDYQDSQSPSMVYVEHGIWGEKQFIQSDQVTFKLVHGSITVCVEYDSIRCLASYGMGKMVVVPNCANQVEVAIIPKKE